MNVYTVFEKDYHDCGAALVFARNGNEARKIGYEYLQWMGDPEWKNVITQRQAGSVEVWAKQESIDLANIDGPHTVYKPRGCARCECIALIEDSGMCLDCEEAEE